MNKNEIATQLRDYSDHLALPLEVGEVMRKAAEALEHSLSAQDEVPAHETIIESGGNLLCTACGTAAPSPAVAEPVAWTSANLLHSLKIAREVAKIPSNHSVAMRAAKRFDDDVPLYATPSPSLAVRDGVDSINYKLLLEKYIEHIGAEEGITYISRLYKDVDGSYYGMSDVKFSADEIAALRDCDVKG